MGAKFQSAMKGMAMAAGGLTIAAAAATKLGQEFQEATNLIAAGTGATGEALEGLTQSFRDVWKSVPQDAATVSGALADINTEFGLSGEGLETLTRRMLDASRAMGEDLGGVIKSTADVLVAFGQPMTDGEKLLDKLTVAAQFSGSSMQGLADKVIDFAPQLQQMGLPMTEAVALIANMDAAGMSASKMMPGLNTAIKKLADEGVTDIAGGLQDAISQIQNAGSDTEGLGIAMDLFGAGAGLRFQDAIKKDVFKLDELVAAMNDSDDVLLELGKTTTTMSDKFDIMKNRAKEFLVPIGNFATMLGPMVIMVPALATGITALAASQYLATAATWAQTAAMTALNIAFGPIGLIIITIGALVFAGIKLWQNWDTVKEKAGIVWHAVGEAIETAINFIIGILNTLIRSTNEAISLWLTPLRGVLTVIGQFIPKAGELARALESVIPEINEVNIEFKAFGEQVVPIAHDAIIETTDVVREMGGVLNDTVTPAIQATTEAISDDLIPSLEELTTKLADEIEQSVTATTKAGDLQHALFILESQQDGVRDAYLEGLLTGADVIKMYEDMSVELTDDIVPAVGKLETKFREVSVAAVDMFEIMSGATDKKVRTFFDTDTGELTEFGQKLSALRDKASGALEIPEVIIPDAIFPDASDYVAPLASIRSQVISDMDAPTGPSIRSRSGESTRWDVDTYVSGWTADVVKAIENAVETPEDAETAAAISKAVVDATTGSDAAIDWGAVYGRQFDANMAQTTDWSGGGGGIMGGGMGGGGACLTINIMGPTYGLDDFEDRVTEAIRDGVRRGGFEDILNTSGDGCR
jgi:TP901 family phage tail tape measure protein